MRTVNKVAKLYKGLQQEHRDLVNRLNNTKGNTELITYLQKEIDKILPELEWFQKVFETYPIPEDNDE